MAKLSLLLLLVIIAVARAGPVKGSNTDVDDYDAPAAEEKSMTTIRPVADGVTQMPGKSANGAGTAVMPCGSPLEGMLVITSLALLITSVTHFNMFN